MPQLRHLAIAADDPRRVADFLVDAFELEEVGLCDNELATGVFLSDGTMNVAVLRFHSDQIGKGADFVGLHHVGFLVDDVETVRSKLMNAGADLVHDRDPDDPDSSFEVKFRTPFGFVVDIAEQGWAGVPRGGAS
jgi:catechol 2,3-dioxygenase-like lactoylglutathione lyase family enzyme